MSRRKVNHRQTSFQFELEGRGKHTTEKGKTCSIDGDVRVCENESAIYVTYEMPDHPDVHAKVSAYRSTQIRGQQCRFEVGGASVSWKLIDKGIGTKLYTAAAKAAARKGCQLRSDGLRSVFSEAFWRKQQRKGRASCGTRASGDYYGGPLRTVEEKCHSGEIPREACKKLLDKTRLPKPGRHSAVSGHQTWPCGFWVLQYPPPDSLAGLKKRRCK